MESFSSYLKNLTIRHTGINDWRKYTITILDYSPMAKRPWEKTEINGDVIIGDDVIRQPLQ
jgi:hypothetical protein